MQESNIESKNKVEDSYLLFSVPAKAIPQPRPRARRFGAKGIQIYTPTSAAIKEYKDLVVASMSPKLPDDWDLHNFVAIVDICFWLPSSTNPCKSDDGEKGAPGESYFRYHWQKPDLDNLTKTILDALNGVVWADDGQVAELILRKFLCPVESVSKRGKRTFMEPKIDIYITFESIDLS